MMDERSENSSRPKLAWLLATVLAGVALSSFIVLGYPQLRSQRPLLSEDEAALLGLINDYRLQHGVSALKVSPALTASAKWMSKDMAEHEDLSFTDSLGRNPAQRVAAFGYAPTDTWGSWPTEALQDFNFAGPDTPEYAFEMLRNSPQHDATMLNDGLVVAGVGKAYNPQSMLGWYWTVVFGGYDDPQAILLTPSPTGTPSSSHLTPTIIPSPTPTPTPTISPTRTPSPSPSTTQTTPAGLIFFLRPPDEPWAPGTEYGEQLGRSDLWVASTDGSAEREISFGKTNVSFSGFIQAEDGPAAYYASGDEATFHLSRVALETGEETEVLSFNSRPWSGAAVSPDGRYAAITEGGDITLADLATGERRTLFESNWPSCKETDEVSCFNYNQPHWSPDGSLLAVGRSGWEWWGQFIVDPFKPFVQPAAYGPFTDIPYVQGELDWKTSDEACTTVEWAAGGGGRSVFDPRPRLGVRAP